MKHYLNDCVDLFPFTYLEPFPSCNCTHIRKHLYTAPKKVCTYLYPFFVHFYTQRVAKCTNRAQYGHAFVWLYILRHLVVEYSQLPVSDMFYRRSISLIFGNSPSMHHESVLVGQPRYLQVPIKVPWFFRVLFGTCQYVQILGCRCAYTLPFMCTYFVMA